MPDTETPATVLRDAAERIRTRGHHRGAFCDPQTGAVCALGAIYNVQPGRRLTLPGPPVSVKARFALQSFVNDLVPIWNDHTVADGEEVAMAMEKAAALWEETHA